MSILCSVPSAGCTNTWVSSCEFFTSSVQYSQIYQSVLVLHCFPTLSVPNRCHGTCFTDSFQAPRQTCFQQLVMSPEYGRSCRTLCVALSISYFFSPEACLCRSLFPGKFMLMLLNHRPSGLGILNRRGGSWIAAILLMGIISHFSLNDEHRETKSFINMQR